MQRNWARGNDMRTGMLVISLLISALIVQLPQVTSGMGTDSAIVHGPDGSRIRLAHDPIQIASDGDFATQATVDGWPGTGTLTDPYIISALEVNGSGYSYGISISDTTVHFIIDDCRVRDTNDNKPNPSGWGIRLSNVQHAIIIDCSIERSKTAGLWAFASQDVNVEGTSVIDGTDAWGIYLASCSDVRLIGCRVDGNEWGIHLEEVKGRVDNCTVRDNQYYGVEIYSSSGLQLDDNIIEDNLETGIYLRSGSYDNEFHRNILGNCSFSIYGDVGTFTTNHIPIDNLVNGLPVHQFIDHNGSGEEIAHEAGQYILGNVSNVVLKGLNISHTSEAITIGHCSGVTVRESDLSSNERGIMVAYGDNVTIEGCKFIGCGRAGILMQGTIDGTVRGNVISGSEFGIWAGDNLKRFLAEDNRIGTCGFGMVLSGAMDPMIRNNTINGSDMHGIGLEMVFYPVIIGNVIVGTGYTTTLGNGVSALYTEDLWLGDNLLISNRVAIEVYASKKSHMSNNTIDSPLEDGIRLVDSTNCTATGNLVFHCMGLGANLTEYRIPPRDNVFWGNSFLCNNGTTEVFHPGRYQAYDGTGLNVWSSDVEGRGNYWSDWTSPDVDHDGIVDAPYEMFGGTQDERPLVEQPLLLVTSPSDFSGEGGKLANNLTWSPPAYSRSGQISGYRVFRSMNGSASVLLQELPGDARYLKDMSVENGIVYDYAVMAFNRYGDGELSHWVRAVPDSSPPTVEVTTPEDGTYWNETSIEASWSSFDNIGVSFHRYRLDGGNWTRTGASMNATLMDLAEGPHSLEVEVFDAMGSSGSDQVTFHVDITAPELFIVRPGDGSFQNTSTVTLEWVGEDVHSGIRSYNYRNDDGGWVGTNSTNVTLIGLPDGPHIFEVAVMDLAGNARIASIDVTIDTLPPVVTILGPQVGEEFKGRPINASWTADGTGSSIVAFQTKLDSGTWKEVGIDTTAVLMGLGKGDHTFWVAVTDEAGNIASDSVTFKVLSNIPEPPLPGMALIMGIVSDKDGEPLHKVRVRSDSGEDTYTDSEGVFYLEVTPGRRVLTFTKKGYEPYDRIVEAFENQTVDMGNITIQKAPSERGPSLQWWELCLCCLVPFAVLILLFIIIGAIARIRRNARRRMDEE